jgi:hypothetical protein
LALEAVARSDARGPIVFVARCSWDSSEGPCATLGSLRIQRNGERTAVPGSVQLKPMTGSTDQLVIFTPASPLDIASTYSVLLGESATPLASFSLFAPAAAAPLDRARATLTSRVEDQGASYSCAFDVVPSGECNPKSGFGWSERGLVHSVLNVQVGGSDGWLFRAYEGPPRADNDFGNFSWLTAPETSTDLSEGVESCISVDAWNVVSDARATRSLCMSGPMLSAKERDLVVPTPNLGACKAVPRHGENNQEATELLAVWCRDRRQHCAGQGNGPFGCAPIDPRCDQLAKTPAGATGPATADGGSRSLDPRADATESEDQAHAQPDDGSADGGCTVGNERAPALQLGPLGLLLLARKRRRRSRRVR